VVEHEVGQHCGPPGTGTGSGGGWAGEGAWGTGRGRTGHEPPAAQPATRTRVQGGGAGCWPQASRGALLHLPQVAGDPTRSERRAARLASRRGVQAGPLAHP
jgi:hypothetical protein